jgi:cytidine deaminase
MATEQELIEKATAMLERSYSPYSHFPVGAALECEDGAVFTGCNIENASYGLTICAERTAAFKAVSEGHRKFKRIVIAGRCDDYCWPCGACRQVLYEFGPNMEVICLNKNGEAARTSLQELLPHGVDAIWLGT